MGAQVDGLFSGIDTTSLIEAMVSAYSAPKESYEDRINTLETRKEKLSDLVSLMGEMEDAIADLEDTSDLLAYSAAYEENDSVTADVDGDAVAGTYSIEVTSLASSEMEVSQGFEDASAEGELATGTMTLTYGTTATEITIDATTSLLDLAGELDDVDGISSYVMDTGDASTPYRLVVQGTDTGEDYTIEIDTSGLTGAGTVPSFSEQSTAANAELTINGIDVTSASNTVSDAIPGLSLSLTDTTTSAIDVTVSMNLDGVEDNVQSVVDAYNAIIDFIDDNSEYDADEGIKGAFVGESSVRRVAIGLRSALTSQFDLDQDYTALSMIGIETDGEGSLSIDSDEFQDKLAENASEIANLFTGEGGFFATMTSRLDVYIDPYEGSLEVRMDAIDERIEDLEDQVERYEDRIERYEERLRKQFEGMESLLSTMSGTSQHLASFLSS